jgi:cytoskeletal protein CcmA (bactofilin family)
MNDGGTMRQVDVSLLKSYFGFEVVGGTSITSLDIDGGADINAAITDADLFIVNDGATGDAQRKATGARLLTYTNAGLLTRAAQTNITSLGTLSALTVSGDLDVDGTTNLDVVDIDGAVNMATTLLVTGNVDFNGDLDVDGTTNLDVVDIDGAVNMATTLLVTGNVDFNGDLDVDGTTNLDAVDIDGAVNMATTLLVTGNVDFNGDLDVDGTTNLDVVDIDGAVDMASTLAVAGVVTANAGVVVDNFTLDGTTLALSSGDMTLDVEGDIILDANGGDIILKDGGGADRAHIRIADSHLDIFSDVNDKDIRFKGKDNGSTITALTIDMSDAGSLDLNNKMYIGADKLIIANAAMTATASELNKLDGATITTSELNLIDGNTSRGTTAIGSGDGVLINDNGTMRMTNVDMVRNFVQSNISDNAITAAMIADDAVDTAQIAGDAINHTKIQDNAIGQEHLQDDVVSGAEMKDLRTFTLKDSAGSTLFTMYGAGDLT